MNVGLKVDFEIALLASFWRKMKTKHSEVDRTSFFFQFC